DLYDAVYGAMLQLLARFYVVTDESEEEAAALLRASVQVMRAALAPLGELLVRQPAGPSHPGRTAGPSFVVKTMHPLPNKTAAWLLLRERIEELRDYTQALANSRQDGEMLTPVITGLSLVGKTLSPAS